MQAMVPPDGCAPPFPAHQAGVLLLDDRGMEARVGTAPTILAYRARGFLVNLSSRSGAPRGTCTPNFLLVGQALYY